MMMKTLFGAVLASTLVLSVGTAAAADSAALYQSKDLASPATARTRRPRSCRLTQETGRAKRGVCGAADEKDIKSGARSNGMTAAMKGVMHLVSDEEIDAIAQWLPSL